LPVGVPAGQSVTFTVNFAPSTTAWEGGQATFTSNASNPNLKLELGGTGATSDPMSAAPSSLSFGQVKIGSNATLPVVLTNLRTWNLTLNAFQVTGSEFSVSGPTLPVVLPPGQAVTLKVTFSPQSAGIAGGSVFVTEPGVVIPISGTGTTIGQLSVTPASLNFGDVNIGNPSTQPATLAATGGPVTITSATSTNSQFTVSGTSFPITINVGQNTEVNVVFTPTTSGTDSATLSFLSNASDSPTSEALSGIGVVAQYYVDLSWTPSTSSVVGYNVYRGPSAGNYTKINTSLDPNTSYTDNTVASGTTYYYAATAVNSAGQESTYSTPVKVNVP
jgi:hypothetical protein